MFHDRPAVQVQAPSLAGTLAPGPNVAVMCGIMLLSFASNYTGAQMQGIMSYVVIAMVIMLVSWLLLLRLWWSDDNDGEYEECLDKWLLPCPLLCLMSGAFCRCFCLSSS